MSVKRRKEKNREEPAENKKKNKRGQREIDDEYFKTQVAKQKKAQSRAISRKKIE